MSFSSAQQNTTRQGSPISRSANPSPTDHEPTDEQIWTALRQVGAESWVSALPDGLDTAVGAGGHHLSPAQVQQLALARILLRDPPVVVLDEATTEAGSAGARDLETAAVAVISGRTAIVVAHRLTQARDCDRIAVMDQGTVVELGTHDELLAQVGRYRDLWAAWSGNTPDLQKQFGCRAASPAARQPGNPATRQPGNPATRQPGSPAARQPGSPAARQPGTPAPRHPGTPAPRQPSHHGRSDQKGGSPESSSG